MGTITGRTRGGDEDCIGCGACGRVCPKDCYTYEVAAG